MNWIEAIVSTIQQLPMHTLESAIQYHCTQIKYNSAGRKSIIHLGILYFKVKKFSQATLYLHKALIQNPNTLVLYYYLAHCYRALNNLKNAIDYYQKVLNIDPQYAPAFNHLGCIFHKQKLFQKAKKYYEYATTLQVHYLDAEINLALLCIDQEQHALAYEKFQSILVWEKNSLIVYAQLGQLAIKQQDFLEAKKYYQILINLIPEGVDIWTNLGAVHLALDESIEAEACFKKALNLDTNHSNARNNLAALYLKQNYLENAIVEYMRYTSQVPNDAEGFYNLGVGHMLLGQLSKAIQCFQKVIALNKNTLNAWCNLAAIYLQLNELKEAYISYQNVLVIAPTHSTATFMSCALRQSNILFPNTKQVEKSIPAFAPLAHIKNLFDSYADHFEQHVATLNYQLPNQLYQLVSPFLKNHHTVLDLGCGTGLMGIQIQAKKTLIGVDISTQMLKEARKKNIYEELIEADLYTFLQGCTQKYDIILCADTLVYLGKLDQFFDVLTHAVKKTTFFAFSVEELQSDQQESYRLEATGRYQHCKTALLRLATHYGWKLCKQRSVIGRINRGQTVNTGLFLLQR